MKLYHGSRHGGLTAIKKSQAQAGEGVAVPADELLEAIYLTPRYEYALAMAARPDGVSHINDEEMKIEFSDPDSFDPNREVYIYELEVDDELVRRIDKNQVVVESLEEIKPVNKIIHKAGDIEQYYELTNWNKELKNDLVKEFKVR